MANLNAINGTPISGSSISPSVLIPVTSTNAPVPNILSNIATLFLTSNNTGPNNPFASGLVTLVKYTNALDVANDFGAASPEFYCALSFF